MLRLQCSHDGSTERHSRVAVLDIGDRLHDYGLATGHAVPSDRPCWVRDFSGRRSDVDLIRFADGYRSGDRTDWALIRFTKIETPNLVRYALDPLGDTEDLDAARVSFATARGLSANLQNCQLKILDFSQGNRRVAHTCRAVPGQSGSPVTRQVNGEHQLVGLHIGQLWMLESPVTGRPDRKGYINLLDSPTVREIEQMIERNR